MRNAFNELSQVSRRVIVLVAPWPTINIYVDVGPTITYRNPRSELKIQLRPLLY